MASHPNDITYDPKIVKLGKLSRRNRVCLPKLRRPQWVNLRRSTTLPGTSGARGKPDVIGAKADGPAEMSAVGGGADVACQGLSGPFLASFGHSRTMKISRYGCTVLRVSNHHSIGMPKLHYARRQREPGARLVGRPGSENSSAMKQACQ